jgi:hypothetical protein
MPQVEKLLVFLASPGDVPTERRYVGEIVADLNRTVASDKDVVLQVVSWENDAYPGYGQDAQAIINAQIAEMSKYALFVGIMWNRLGTPTSRAPSGTVEEFERAVQASKQNGQPDIWFYFRESPSKMDTEEQLEQRGKVLAFKKQVQTNGMPWPYKNPLDFRDKFRNQMILWLNARSGTPVKSRRLGEDISSIIGPPTTGRSKRLEPDKNLVRDYLSVLPEKAQQLRVDAERQRLAELDRSREIRTTADFVARTLTELVTEFRRQGVSIKLDTTKFPANAFSSEPYQLKLSFNDSEFWSIHLVDRQIEKVGLMFVRVVRDANGQELITNDSIVFRWVGTDRYGFSLNDRISQEVRSNVFEGLDSIVHPFSSAEADLERFLVNLTKYEIARAKAKSA